MSTDLENYSAQKSLNIIRQEGISIVSKTIGEITFTGSGLDDMSNGGLFTGFADVNYEVVIDGTGTPDTFKWSDDGGVTYTETVAITGSDQTLSNGVTIKFQATTGHTLADKWTFTAKAKDPVSIQKKPETVITVSLAPSGTTTSNAIDLRNFESASITVKGDFAVGATDGMTVEIFTSPDNVNYDVDAWASTGLEPDFVANTTKQKTTNLDTEPISYAKVKVTNDDAVKSLANLSVVITKVEK